MNKSYDMKSHTFAANQKIKERDYWLNKLAGELVKSSFPFDNRQNKKNSKIETIHYQFPRELVIKFTKVINGSDPKMHVILAANLAVLLNKYTGNKDIIIGTPIYKQSTRGEFINTVLVVRNEINDGMTFKQLLEQMKQVLLEAIANQNYPMGILAEQLNYPFSSGEDFPLFDTSLMVENIHDINYLQHINHNMLFSFSRTSDTIDSIVKYNSLAYTKTHVEKIADQFILLLEKALDNLDVKISHLEFLSYDEKKKMLMDFNETDFQYDDKSVHLLFANQVENAPDNIAIVGEFRLSDSKSPTDSISPPPSKGNILKTLSRGHLSYKELNEKATQLAYYLLEKGVQSDSIVTIEAERSPWIIIAMLGIMKANGAYLPIDPTYPSERIQYILADSNAIIRIATSVFYPHTRTQGQIAPAEMIFLEELFGNNGGFAPVKTNNPPQDRHHHHPGNLAYIIYTSASTGKPKGVFVEHRNLSAYLHAFFREFEVTSRDIALQQASFSFDASVEEIYPVLVKGGRMVIPSTEVILDIDWLVDFISITNVTLISCSPLMLNEFNKYNGLKTINTFINGGDVLKREYIDNLLKKTRVYNTYGPTETTVCVTYYKCVESTSTPIPIGKPISNYKVYILDENFKLVPIGVPGELCVAGAGVTRGYSNKPELTSEKFLIITNKLRNKNSDSYHAIGFNIDRDISGLENITKIYRTGDLARWLNDGNIEFLGRIDHQVKIRGFRIELGEIENRLLKHNNIKETIVLLKEDETGDKYLSAYLVPDPPGSIRNDEPFTITQLREYLAGQLPHYMIPSYFIPMDKFPLTHSGKIDRKSLPMPKIVRGSGYIAPRNEVEQQLTKIWTEVLGLEEPVGVTDNFFELGGHSLKALTMLSKVHKTLNVRVPLAELFRTPTIGGLSNYMSGSVGDKYSAIEPIEKREYYSLSSPQRRLYILQQMDLKSTVYNMPQAIPLGKDPQLERIGITFKKLIARHENLRTSFHMEREEPVQKIHDEVEFKIEYLDSGSGERNSENPSLKPVNDFARPFDLSKAPLLRVGVITPRNGESMLAVDMHHIICDGISQDILLHDFAALYQGKELAPLRLHYKDFAHWQKNEARQNQLKQQEIYWTRQFIGEIPVLNLPLDFSRPRMQNFAGDTLTFEIAGNSTRQLNEIALKENATLFMVLLAAFNVLLGKLSNQEDIIVGTAVAGRSHADLEKIIGMFVNTLGLRNYPSGEKTFGEFLAEVREQTLIAFENRDYPFEELVERVEVSRDTGRNPLFDVMFSFQDGLGNEENAAAGQGPAPETNPGEYQNKTSKFDLTLASAKVDNRLLFTFQYCIKLFKQETVQRFITYFKNVIATVLENTEQPIKNIDVLPGEEKQTLLETFNETGPAYPREKTLTQLFHEQVSMRSDSISILGKVLNAPGKAVNSPVVSFHSLTYRELDKKSDQMAHYLVHKGVRETDFVGVLLEQSIEMLIGILGILKAGCAYVPLDPKAPETRRKRILEECRVMFVLTEARLKEKEYATMPQTEIGLEPCHDNFAYVIFTSGSTGIPKGVAVTHSNLSPLLHWGYKRLNIGSTDRTLQNLSYYFDWSVWEIFITLTTGASLYSLPSELLQDSEEITKRMNVYGITVLHATPTQYGYIANVGKRLETLRYLFIGAEKLPLELLRRSIQSVKADCRIFNMYGPTECTIISAVYEIERSPNALESISNLSSVPIGVPVGNAVLVVLDNYFRVCPVNVVGELYIGGDGVSAGYLNDMEKTGHSFKEKVSFKEGKPGSRFYKTGDWARWLESGSVEFLGRIDHQVKIRGYRIELGEIENCLLNHPGVKEAVVLSIPGNLPENTEDQYLCAYIVLPQEGEGQGTAGIDTEAATLREYLSSFLPGYMIPTYFVMIDKIPLDPNGKIDRKDLPRPEQTSTVEYLAPRDEIEKQLEKIWSEVLFGSNVINTKPIGIDENFFQLGGHSLKATVLISRLHKELNVKVPLSEIFKTPTIRGLADYIRKAVRNKYSAVEPVERKEYYSLSYAQQRMYLLQEMEQENIAYNMPQFIPLEESIDLEKWENTFKKLINRHESLRTSFHMLAEQQIQRIMAPGDVTFEIDCYDAADQGELQFFVNEFVRPFDLAKAPLLRAGLITLKKGKKTLAVDMHHIICDGISQDILLRDFTALYQGKELVPLRLHYKDFAHWQKNEAQQNQLKQQEIYWTRQFIGEIPVLNLPLDFSRPRMQSFDGDTLTFEIIGNRTRQLNEIALTENATLFMVLLAAFNVLLGKLSNQEDIIIGTAVAGRSHADLEKIIGMFVNTLGLRNYPSGEKTFREFLTEVREQTLYAFENRDYPFEELVERVEVSRDTGRNPLFDVMFSFQNGLGNEGDAAAGQGPAPETNPQEYKNKTSKFDLTLASVRVDDRLLFTFQYCIKLFKQETVQRFITYFKNIIATVLENTEQPIKNIDVLSGEEKQTLLETFNETGPAYPREKTLTQLFHEQVSMRSDSISILGKVLNAPGKAVNSPVVPFHSLTYRELDERSNQMAHYLVHQGVRETDFVGVLLEQSIEMLIGILGILKAGCAYVPLDPKAPEARRKRILDECRVMFVLTEARLKEKEYATMPQTEIGLEPCHDNFAYVIFTSGSTGIPKGVAVTHSNLSPLLHWGYKRLNIGSTDRTLQNLSYYFDWSVWEIFITLTTGASLYSLPSEILQNPEEITIFMNVHRITVLHATPTQYGYIANVGKRLETLRYLFIGAEKLTLELLQRSIQSVKADCRIFNMYGPTECTIISAVYEIERSPNALESISNLSSAPIGVPVGNAVLLVLDKYFRVCPVNVVGELYIGGDGVSAGYLNDMEKTGHSFKEKVSFKEGKPGNRFYKTGDLARWLESGNVEFLGRIDHQVKIRGYRIELGEIENCLLNHPGVKEAVVLSIPGNLPENPEDQYLCAYIVLQQESEGQGTAGIDTEGAALREYLSGFLPGYMIPTYFVVIDKIPLDPNGKIDRKALPSPEQTSTVEYLAPRDEIEKKIIEIWSEVLGINKEKISINSNFFSLGGHSLKANLVAAKIQNIFNINMPLGELFKNSSIKKLSEYIQTRGKGIFSVNDDQMILLRLEDQKARHLFFIHDGTGEVEAYAKFSNLLNLRINFWGIQIGKIEKYTPENFSLKTVAKKYIEKIKAVQPPGHGPYFIAGWSIGGGIALEMVKQLEAENEKVAFLGIIDSVLNSWWIMLKLWLSQGYRFSMRSEKKLAKYILLDDLKKIKKKLKEIKKIEDFWPEIIKYVESGRFNLVGIKRRMRKYGLQVFTNFPRMTFRECMYYVNLARTISKMVHSHIPKGKIKAPLFYFVARETMTIKEKRWGKLTTGTSKYYDIPGNHLSIWNIPNVSTFKEKFSEAVNEAIYSLDSNAPETTNTDTRK